MARPVSAKSTTRGFSPQAYLEHMMGLCVLLAWRQRWERIRVDVPMEGPMVRLGLLPSQRFALGFPTTPRYGRLPFLAVQPDEGMFFGRIAWAGAFVDMATSTLVLTTRKMLGDGDNVEDIPAMGLSIAFDHERKLQVLERHGRLAVRSLWFDEDGAHVAAGAPMAQMPLRSLGPGDTPFPEGAIAQDRSLADLVAQRLAQTSGQYVPYQGPQAVVPGDLRDLVEPFRPDQVPQVRPKD